MLIKDLCTLSNLEADEIRNQLVNSYTEQSSFSTSSVYAYVRDTYSNDVLFSAEGFICVEKNEIKAFLILGESLENITGEIEKHIVELEASSDYQVNELVQKAILFSQDKGSNLYFELNHNNEQQKRIKEVLTRLKFIPSYSILRTKVEKDSNNINCCFMFSTDLDREFAHQCLVDGFINTYGNNMYFDLDKAKKYVHNKYQILNTNNRLSFIGKVDGNYAAHGLVEIFCTDNNQLEARLVDIYVIKEYKKLGISTQMWRYIKNYLVRKGVKYAEGTLISRVSEEPEKLVKGLHYEGWWIDRTVYIKPYENRNDASVTNDFI